MGQSPLTGYEIPLLCGVTAIYLFSYQRRVSKHIHQTNRLYEMVDEIHRKLMLSTPTDE